MRKRVCIVVANPFCRSYYRILFIRSETFWSFLVHFNHELCFQNFILKGDTKPLSRLSISVSYKETSRSKLSFKSQENTTVGFVITTNSFVRLLWMYCSQMYLVHVWSWFGVTRICCFLWVYDCSEYVFMINQVSNS